MSVESTSWTNPQPALFPRGKEEQQSWGKEKRAEIVGGEDGVVNLWAEYQRDRDKSKEQGGQTYNMDKGHSCQEEGAREAEGVWNHARWGGYFGWSVGAPPPRAARVKYLPPRWMIRR